MDENYNTGGCIEGKEEKQLIDVFQVILAAGSESVLRQFLNERD